jgi:hypothetical protein
MFDAKVTLKIDGGGQPYGAQQLSRLDEPLQALHYRFSGLHADQSVDLRAFF